MATVYSVDVNVNLLNNASGAGGGSGSLQQLNRSIQDVQRSSERMMGVWTKLFAFRELERFGKAGVDAFKGIVQNAGTLEESMLNVRLGLNLTADQTDKLRDKFYALDQAHKTSANEMARTALILQQSGIRDQGSLLGLMEPGQDREGLLTFQDVMKSRAEPVGPEESARLAMQFIDTAAIKSVEGQAKMLDLVARALQFDPQAAPGGLLNAFQNIHRTADFAHMPLEEQMQLAAMTTMGGQSGREATQIGHLVGQMELVGHAPGKSAAHKAAAMRHMGLLDAAGDPTGDIFSMLTQLAKVRQEDPEGSKRLLATAFPDVRRQEEVLELTEPAKQAQLKGVIDAWNKLKSLGEQHDVLMSGTNSQLTVLNSNLQDISSSAGTDLLSSLKDAIGGLNDWTGKIKEWQTTAEGKQISGIAAGTLGVSGKVLETASQVAIVALTLKMLGLTSAATTGVIGVVAAGTTALTYAAMKDANFEIKTMMENSPLELAIQALTRAINEWRGAGIEPGTNANRPWLNTPLDPVPDHITAPAQTHHAIQHALHTLTKAASKGYSQGVRAAPGLFLNPTTGAGPR